MARGISYAITFASGAAVSVLIAPMIPAAPSAGARLALPEAVGTFSVLVHPLVRMIGLILFLYVGAEAGIGAWLFSYLRATSALSASVASWAVSLFWLGLIAGRMLGGALANRSSPKPMSILAATLCVTALSGLILSAGSPGFGAAMIVLAGVGFGPVFPNMIAIGAASFPADVGRMTSTVSAGGALGAAFVPWMMGFALATSGARLSMELALGATLVMLLLLVNLAANPREPRWGLT